MVVGLPLAMPIRIIGVGMHLVPLLLLARAQVGGIVGGTVISWRRVRCRSGGGLMPREGEAVRDGGAAGGRRRAAVVGAAAVAAMMMLLMIVAMAVVGTVACRSSCRNSEKPLLLLSLVHCQR